MSTWYVPHSPRRLYRTWRLIRRTRGPIASLVALWRYWTSKPEF